MATGEFEVEDILDSRLSYSKPEDLVQWLGYCMFELNWEFISHLTNATDILRYFLSCREWCFFHWEGVIIGFIQMDLKVCSLMVYFILKSDGYV